MGAGFRTDRSVWRFDFERATGYQVIAEGTPEEIRDDENVQAAYLGGGGET